MSSSNPAPIEAKSTPEPNTQAKTDHRKNWPEWMKQLPRLKFAMQPNQDYQLIDRNSKAWQEATQGMNPESLAKIEEDIEFLEYELLRLFRERDYKAAFNQNLYRVYQIAFMLLASAATIIGGLQGLSIGTNPNLVPILALLETVVALFTTYLATLSGREPPLPLWINNRRRAEYLRREYFRFLANLPPYDTLDGYKRKQLLSERAADINRGMYPDKAGAE